jgi:hypothetical protein
VCGQAELFLYALLNLGHLAAAANQYDFVNLFIAFFFGNVDNLMCGVDCLVEAVVCYSVECLSGKVEVDRFALV